MGVWYKSEWTYLAVRVHVWEGAGAACCWPLYGGTGEGVGGVEGGVAQQPEHGLPAGGVLLHPGPRLPRPHRPRLQLVQHAGVLVEDVLLAEGQRGEQDHTRVRQCHLQWNMCYES